jgi:replicative superfamily II helicase
LNEINRNSSAKFGLVDKVKRNGVFEGETGFLISAPTATGKSQIGIRIIKANLANKPASETFIYLVPFKALAEEMFAKIEKDIPKTVNINIKTGDYDRPFDVKETDVLVATYESMDGIIQEGRDFYPTIVIADEFSIVADSHRGAKIEALISYLARLPATKLFALSAVLREPERIARWLGVSLVEGDEKDRPVPLRVESVFYKKGRKQNTVEKLVKRGLKKGSVLIFCSTKRSAERLCWRLRDLVSSTLNAQEARKAKDMANALKKSFPYLVDIPELVGSGVAYHHAGLELELRNEVAKAFSERRVRVLTATTTLSAGVNLPARTVIVRDITRFERGLHLIPVAEIVNMLGRAGRPNLDTIGEGCFLVPAEKKSQPRYKKFTKSVKRRAVERVESQIPRNLTNTLQFILSTAARYKGIKRDDLIKAYNDSLWGFEKPLNPPMLSGEDLLKRIDQVLEPQHNVRIRTETASVSGNVLRAKGGSRDYEISISPTGSRCSCLAYQFSGYRSCKHVKQLQFEAIKGQIRKRIPEAASIAIASLKETDLQQDPMYLLAKGIEVLLGYQFLEKREEKLFITQDGRQALLSYLLSMPHVRILRDRMRKAKKAKDEIGVIKWAIEDFHEPTANRDNEDKQASGLSKRMQDALWEHIEGREYREISVLEQMYIQRFLNAKDQLDQIFNVYIAFCPKENQRLASQIRVARNRVHYGCKKEALPLMVLRIEAIGESSKAMKLIRNGIRDVRSLAKISELKLTNIIEISQDEAKRTVDKAKSICTLLDKFIEESSSDLGELRTLAARTGIKIDDLLDYFLPESISRLVRGY